LENAYIFLKGPSIKDVCTKLWKINPLPPCLHWLNPPVRVDTTKTSKNSKFFAKSVACADVCISEEPFLHPWP